MKKSKIPQPGMAYLFIEPQLHLSLGQLFYKGKCYDYKPKLWYEGRILPSHAELRSNTIYTYILCGNTNQLNFSLNLITIIPSLERVTIIQLDWFLF